MERGGSFLCHRVEAYYDRHLSGAGSNNNYGNQHVMFLKCFICYGKYSDSATEEELVDAFSEAGTVTDFRFFL